MAICRLRQDWRVFHSSQPCQNWSDHFDRYNCNGIISAALCNRKIENILALYTKYSHPDSEDGEKLSGVERERLFELFLRELKGLAEEFGSGIFSNVGKGVQSSIKAIGIRSWCKGV